MYLNIDVVIQDERWQEEIENIENFCKNIMELTLNYFDIFSDIKEVEVTIVFTEDKEITELNKNYRGKNSPTNVLSFPIEDFNRGKLEYISEFTSNLNNILHLGDIIISYETVKKEALEQKKTLLNHVTHLIIHSLLHLIGFDHIEEEDAVIMENLEIKLLKKLNIASPY